jgi:RNA polymerase sigma-70 factor (ECF subfamily)
MDGDVERRTDMSQTASVALPAPEVAPVASFDALYRATATEVYAYVASLLRDRAAAEDVTAQAFERAYRRRSSFDARRGSQRAWLFAIARNAALDELRRRRRTAGLTVDPAALEAPPGEAEDDEAARRATLRAALDALDARDRELIALKFHAGLSNAEIARVLGVTTTNAGTRVHRAVTRLREACHVAP